MKKNIKKAVLFPVLAAAVFFAVTFTIYFFNLDMKATALLEPWFRKHYDDLPRKQYI